MSESFSFNLVDEPWLPCVRPDGSRTLLSLRDTLVQAHQLQSLSGDSPPETAALHRLLLAILHRIFGPADHDQWAALWDLGRWKEEAVNAYLDQWRHRFDLFDAQYPFYQAPKLYCESSWGPIQRLVLYLSPGNVPFEHCNDDNPKFFTPAEAARAVIVAQNYGLSGTSGAFHPRTRPGAKKIQAMFSRGAITTGICFLIQGNSLFQTLMLNLIQYPDDNVVPHFVDDAPAWEREDPCGPERGPLSGYLDYLTWQNRRIVLKPTREKDGQVVVYSMRWEPANPIENLPDPMQYIKKNSKSGFQPLLFYEDRALWRDSGALLSLHRTDGHSSVEPPSTFRWLKELMYEESVKISRSAIYNVLALGMSVEPVKAKVHFDREEQIPLPLAYFTQPTLVERLVSGLQVCEKVAEQLKYASRVMGMYLQLSDPEKKKWDKLKPNEQKGIKDWVTHTGAERHYWSTLGLDFQLFIVDLVKDEENAVLRWHQALRDAALAAFERAASYTGTDGRSFKAVVRGRSVLRSQLRRVIPAEQKEVMA